MLTGRLTMDAVESYFPDRVITVEERAIEVGLKPGQVHLFRKIHGLDTLRLDPDLDLYDLVLAPARKALAGIDPASVRYLFYVHAMQEVAPPPVDVARQIRARLGLPAATAVALTQQNCATTLSAIDLAGVMLASDGDPAARALVVAGEKVAVRETRVLFNSCVLGEGAAACLLSWNGPGAAIRSFGVRTFGEYFDGIRMTAQQHRSSAAVRPGIMRELIETTAAEGGCSVDELHMILPTNSNNSFWGETIREMAFDDGKIFLENIPRYSHCLAADVLVNYVTLREEGRLVPGRHYMFLAFGVGMTYAAMTFTP